jgi:hypothetical protein
MSRAHGKPARSLVKPAGDKRARRRWMSDARVAVDVAFKCMP